MLLIFYLGANQLKFIRTHKDAGGIVWINIGNNWHLIFVKIFVLHLKHRFVWLLSVFFNGMLTILAPENNFKYLSLWDDYRTPIHQQYNQKFQNSKKKSKEEFEVFLPIKSSWTHWNRNTTALHIRLIFFNYSFLYLIKN